MRAYWHDIRRAFKGWSRVIIKDKDKTQMHATPTTHACNLLTHNPHIRMHAKHARYTRTPFTQATNTCHAPHARINACHVRYIIRGGMAFSSRVALLWIHFQFWEHPKVAGSYVGTVRRLAKLYNLVIRQKLLHKVRWMRWRVIVVKKPVPAWPETRSVSSHGITQSFQNFNVIFFVDRLTSWSKFVVHNTLTIEK